MRKLVISLLILVLIGAAAGAVWVFWGSRISLFADHHRIMDTAAEKVQSVRYEGNGTGGILQVNQVALSLNEMVAPVQTPSVGSTKDGKLGLAAGGKVFPLGPLPKGDDDSTALSAIPDNGDDARITLGHSLLSWPTPFDFNFMTGASPTWKRHTYQKLTWKKPDGRQLNMLWRYEQFYYPGNGWASPTMTHQGETGLIRMEIKP